MVLAQLRAKKEEAINQKYWLIKARRMDQGEGANFDQNDEANEDREYEDDGIKIEEL